MLCIGSDRRVRIGACAMTGNSLVMKGCLSACLAVSLRDGSVTNNLLTKSFPKSTKYTIHRDIIPPRLVESEMSGYNFSE